jgi:hypothetical protein
MHINYTFFTKTKIQKYALNSKKQYRNGGSSEEIEEASYRKVPSYPSPHDPLSIFSTVRSNLLLLTISDVLCITSASIISLLCVKFLI